jgi:hypothetical protein
MPEHSSRYNMTMAVLIIIFGTLLKVEEPKPTFSRIADKFLQSLLNQTI